MTLGITIISMIVTVSITTVSVKIECNNSECHMFDCFPECRFTYCFCIHPIRKKCFFKRKKDIQVDNFIYNHF